MKTEALKSISLGIFLIIAPILYSQQSEDLRSQIQHYGIRGWYNVQYNINLDSAEYYLVKALELQYAYYDTIDDRVATNHVSLASVYRQFHNNSDALEHLSKAEKILNECEPNHLFLGNIYHNKGILYKTNNDLFRTREYFEYSLDFLEKNGYQNTTNYAHVFSSYIRLLLELEEYNLAEEQLSLIDFQSLNLNTTTEFRFHIIKATTYSQIEKYDLALFHFAEAKAVLDTGKDIASKSDIITYYHHIIDFNILYGNNDDALEQCANALGFIETLDPTSTKNKTIYQSNIVYRIAEIQFRLENYERALDLVVREIDKLNSFFNNLSFANPRISVRNEFTSILPELYILKSKVLFNMYKSTNDLDNLIASIGSYQQAIEIINSLKLSMQNEESKYFATSKILEIYNEAIYVGRLLYLNTNELQYLEKSFEFAESSKSFALFSEIKNVEAIEFSGLPSNVKEMEELLSGKIQGYEEMLYDEQLSTTPDSNQVSYYKDRLFHLNAEHDALLKDIEINYSQYYEFKYKAEFVSLEDVQKKLPYRDALIEYVLTDTLLITFVIDKKGINVLSQEVGLEFANECIEYYQLIHRQNFSKGVHDNYRRFVHLGRKFYKILVEPCFQFTDKKNLTIVPDGAITYLPFGCLLTDEADMEYINYLNLPYMVKDFSIGYSHSSTLMFSERFKSKSPDNKVLAFAPKYAPPPDMNDTALLRQVINEDEFLLPLRGIINEVQSINETVPARVFLNERATEANFKKYASDYNVLHLAMHTIMKDQDPLRSLLAFTNASEPDSTEDNKLYAYEIYNMKLNAQMAVLSSCSSGFGKMLKGEGMMSLARGFIYAGCPSIVMTLWQVADQSSSELMTSFYKYLKKGKSKQEAMRLAKIDYLNTADDLTSNPYFWSGFVVVGDSSPIYRKSGMAYWILIITIFVGVLVYFQFKRKRSL